MPKLSIELRCPKCNRTQIELRSEYDPDRAMTVEIVCPLCDKGDFDSPRYFDPCGNPVDAWPLTPQNKSLESGIQKNRASQGQ